VRHELRIYAAVAVACGVAVVLAGAVRAATGSGAGEATALAETIRHLR
jgi:hypothetical protein